MKKILLILFFTLSSATSTGNNEISLFNSSGEAVVYIVPDDDYAIYTWDGEAIAYLHASPDVFTSNKLIDIYGWNGKHLGWFNNGIVIDHNGDISCSIRESHPSPLSEPVKYGKYSKFRKNERNIQPDKPLFSESFGELECLSLLKSGEY